MENSCDPYFLNHNVSWTRAVPGFASGTIKGEQVYTGWQNAHSDEKRITLTGCLG